MKNENGKITCTTCKQEFNIPASSLPKNLDETAIICPYCMRLGMKGVHPDNLEEEMKFRREEMSADMLLDRTSEAFTEYTFPDFWKECKGGLKELSKKELAEESFGTGVNALLSYVMHNQKNDKERIKILKQIKEIFEQKTEEREIDEL